MTTKSSLLKILEKSSRKGLGRGNLGVLVARAGVGKTACLVHIAMDKLLRNERLVHASLQDSPEKVTSYYNVIFSELVQALNLKNPSEVKAQIDKNRMILAYLNQSFDLRRLRENLKNLSEKVGFAPDTIIVDGLDFSKAAAEMFEGFKKLAQEFKVEVWFSALSKAAAGESKPQGIPPPADRFDSFFSIVIELQPTQSAVELRLLKDHESPKP
ncbi:MAG: hypothetical protein ACM335_06370, partial [Deltaproteobacteria bacterium]